MLYHIFAMRYSEVLLAALAVILSYTATPPTFVHARGNFCASGQENEESYCVQPSTKYTYA